MTVEQRMDGQVLNVLTVDVEDYFMVSAFADRISADSWGLFDQRVPSNTARVLDILDRHSVKATCFVVGWVADRFPKLVKEIVRRGHEVGCHSYSHRLVYRLTAEEFREDTRRAKGLLEDITGEKVRGYRAPSYSITKDSLWALDVLIDEGFEYDSSIFPVRHDLYGLPGFGRFPKVVESEAAGEIFEIPPSTLSILGRNIPFGGGGYLRLYPIALTEWGVRSMNEKEGRPAVVYIHPWEIDPGQPRLNGTRRSVFRHYVNIEQAETKLVHLLSRFRFAPVRDAFPSGGIGSHERIQLREVGKPQ